MALSSFAAREEKKPPVSLEGSVFDSMSTIAPSTSLVRNIPVAVKADLSRMTTEFPGFFRSVLPSCAYSNSTIESTAYGADFNERTIKEMYAFV